jgi:hypothetical protein
LQKSPPVPIGKKETEKSMWRNTATTAPDDSAFIADVCQYARTTYWIVLITGCTYPGDGKGRPGDVKPLLIGRFSGNGKHVGLLKQVHTSRTTHPSKLRPVHKLAKMNKVSFSMKTGPKANRATNSLSSKRELRDARSLIERAAFVGLRGTTQSQDQAQKPAQEPGTGLIGLTRGLDLSCVDRNQPWSYGPSSVLPRLAVI